MQWNVKVKQIFCPKCKCTDLEELSAEHPDFQCRQVFAEEEKRCNRCGHIFSVNVSYNESGFMFIGEDMDDKDYIIEVD